MPRDRTWGYWTEQKLGMLAEYLPAFTRASQRVSTTIYLDLFAGDARNLSRVSGQEIAGSPKVAIDAHPPLGKIRLFELPGEAERLEASLRAEYPDRDIVVYPGDCNATIDRALADLEPWAWAPTFALIDQYAAEIHWSTLAKIAAFKKRSRTKAELWLLFAHSMLPRGLGGENLDSAADFADRIRAMYGNDRWFDAYEARVTNVITPAQFRDEMVNLMRWQLGEGPRLRGHARVRDEEHRRCPPLHDDLRQ